MTTIPASNAVGDVVRGTVADTLQRGALGILGLMCITAMAATLYAVVYLGPKVVESIQAIAPTITAEMARQSESHTAERKAWSDERIKYIEIIQRLSAEHPGSGH